MINNLIRSILYFIVFIALQVLLFNNINFLRLATPFVYLYIILKQPMGTSRVQLLLISFLAGLLMDIFSNTPGMHATVCTFIGLAREPIIHLFIGKELADGTIPSYQSFRFGGFFRYTLLIVITHHTLLLLLESLVLFDPLFLIIRIGVNTLLTTALILVFEAFNFESIKSGE